MAYNDFAYPTVLSYLGLTLAEAPLFVTVAVEPLSPEFTVRFTASATLAQAINTEKARS